ncbi:MAG: DUF4062 domain-containing protein [Bacteroidota bacterium]|nr:DUF4062 domain-containing protein [Bacteroidota bacterium]
MSKQRANRKKIRILVASTIYGFEDQLEQICSTLQGYGYEVWNSHLKTIPVHPGKSNKQNCLKAVNSCDIFFGIIRPHYGSGVIGKLAITHQEMRRAIKLKKPRWFVAHHDISVARQILKQYMFDKNGNPQKAFKYKETNILDDIRVIHLYNEAILNDIPPQQRVGHWVDEYFELSDILQCIKTQFASIDRIRKIVKEMNKKP